MESLLRFLAVAAGLAVAIWAGMFALSHYVQPQPREMVQTIPASRLGK